MNTQPQFTPLAESQPGAIRPEVLAKKIADVRRLKLDDLAKYCDTHPRAIEALWFIQWMSTQPGALTKFAKELIAFIGPRLGTRSMLKYGRRKYSRAECMEVLRELPPRERDHVELSADAPRWYNDEISDTARKELTEKFESVLAKRNEPYFRELVHESAEEELVNFFSQICCGEREDPGLWFCADILAEVLAFMDARAEQVGRRLARTVVAEKVFDALEYASSERVFVQISGDSRFGKTEAIDTYAAMWPGRLRVVRTPSSNSERDLIRAVAEAFGIHQTFGTRGETLKDKVEFVIRFSGIALAFDEGAFLVPSNFSATTPPARLNWMRCAVIDRKVPCVIVVTPQSYNGALDRFVRKTKYSIEQFLGREALRVPLPNELSHEDLLAVARVHFPEADEDLLGLIAAKSMQSESYLKAVENIARRARYNAKKRGAKRLTLADVDKAIAEVMPAPAAPAPVSLPTNGSGAAKPRQRKRSAIAAAFQIGRADKISSIPGRGATPSQGESARRENAVAVS